MSRRGTAGRRTPAALTRRDDDPLAVFVRGATVGAFVGAVIAGSTLWRRLRRGDAGSSVAARPAAGRPGESPDATGRQAR